MKTKEHKRGKEGSESVKKTLLISLLIFSGLTIIGVGSAAAAPLVSVDPASTTRLSPDDTFSIDVLVDSESYNLRACTIDLTYNSSALTVDSVTYKNLLGTEVLESPDTCVTDSRIRHGIARKTAVNPSAPVSGTFITVNFTVNSGAENDTYTLHLSNVSFKDENNVAIPDVTESDGTVTVGINEIPTTDVDEMSRISSPTPTLTPPTVVSTPTPEVTPTAPPIESPTPTPEEPGFEAVFAIAGLFAVAYLVMRRKRK